MREKNRQNMGSQFCLAKEMKHIILYAHLNKPDLKTFAEQSF